MTGTRTVLVVEDDVDTRTTLADVLLELGCSVLTAADGAEGLTILRSGAAPTLIILDLTMPRVDGEKFRTAMLADARLSKIPVVLFTGSAAGSRVAEELGLPVLKKPVRAVDLVTAIDRAHR